MIFLKTISVLFAILILFTNVSAATAPTVERKGVPLITIQDKIVKYADEYNVSAEVISNVIRCESNFNPEAVNDSAIEYSVGLVQINLRVHKDVTFEQAVDPDFAIKYIASRVDKTPHMWSCYTIIYG
jgi:soluble lytic murein transglycosylase-like protein